MNELIFIGIVAGLFLILILQAMERKQAQDSQPPADSQLTDKEMRKEAILSAFTDNDPHSISQLEHVVPVSRRTVRRYLGELVSEGKVEQIGQTGRFVQYKKK